MALLSPVQQETTKWYRPDLNEFTSNMREHGVILFMLLFFSLVFLVAFFFFYFVYNKFTAITAATTATSSVGPVFRGAAEAVNKSKGLDLEAIKKLMPAAVLYVSLEVKEKMSECSICLGLFEEVEMVKVMPYCFHVFHADCVDTWLSSRPSCPLCRASLDHSVSVSIPAE